VKIWAQKIVPQHWLSRCVGKLAKCQVKWLKNCFIRWFIKQYQVDMSEAQQSDYRQFSSFNAFFTRALMPDARPMPDSPHAVACPVDGFVSELGYIENDQIFQAKGRQYTLSALLANESDMVNDFKNGAFLTAYLSPKDYHRVHMPVSGTLKRMIHVPGQLFSVNPYTVTHVDQLFARNERVICLFETERGPMAVILVGAIIVAGVVMPWHGIVTPPSRPVLQQWDYAKNNVVLERGAEMGLFQLGSTVIVLFAEQAVQWDLALKTSDILRLGQIIA
jgi:phosphatidylserine decarboxylase